MGPRLGGYLAVGAALVAATGVSPRADARSAPTIGDAYPVTMSDAEEPGDDDSYFSDVSLTGRYVAFFSSASNLVPGDTNDRPDFFVRDLRAGTTERVSLTNSDRQVAVGQGFSPGPSISRNGRFVAFSTRAALVRHDSNPRQDVFVRDRVADTTTLASISTDGEQGNMRSESAKISGNGRFVCFTTMTHRLAGPRTKPGVERVVVRDLEKGVTRLVGPPSDIFEYHKTDECSISRTGRYMAFTTDLRLVKRDRDGTADVYVRDMRTRRFALISQSTTGLSKGKVRSPKISDDGRFVTFDSQGAYVKGDTNRQFDVFVRDRVKRTTVRASVPTDGAESTRSSWFGSISRDGRYVGFETIATLVPEDTDRRLDHYARDLKKGETFLISGSASGPPAVGPWRPVTGAWPIVVGCPEGMFPPDLRAQELCLIRVSN